MDRGVLQAGIENTDLGIFAGGSKQCSVALPCHAEDGIGMGQCVSC